MKTKHILFLFLASFGTDLFGHEQVVHEAITKHAVDSVSQDPEFASFLQVIASDDRTLDDAKSKMGFGSYHEDDDAKHDPVGGNRSLNHFYNPITGKGLSESPIIGGSDPIGRNSFEWASTFNEAGVNVFPYIINNKDTKNIWSWQNARDYEWLGLTETNQLARQTNVDNMFHAVGQVMHLLQDASQPQHVRNEQHLTFDWVKTPWRSPIEHYGKENINKLNYSHTILDWRNCGFTKMEDFWTRHFYSGANSSALVADASASGTSSVRLGMAEFANGNFLGARHLFPEYFNHKDIEYFPYPSRNTSTDYQAVKSNPLSGLQTNKLANGQEVKSIYVRKTGDGISINHICRVNYLGLKTISGLLTGGTPYCTINDDNVLKDYHDVLIPKAVAYSAGLLDYYFRGTMDVGVTNNSDGTFALQVTNTSSQDFSSGSFFLLQETNGIRAFVQTNDLSGTLPSGSNLTINCSCVSQETKCILVYRGTIGVDGDNHALDPVDDQIAIAVKTFTLEPPAMSNLTWTVTYSEDGASLSGSGGSATMTAASSGTGDSSVGSQVYGVSSDFFVCSSAAIQVDYSFTVTGPNHVISADQYHISNNANYLITIGGLVDGDSSAGGNDWLTNGTYSGHINAVLLSGSHHLSLHVQSAAGAEEWTRDHTIHDNPNWPWEGWTWEDTGSFVQSGITGTITVTFTPE